MKDGVLREQGQSPSPLREESDCSSSRMSQRPARHREHLGVLLKAQRTVIMWLKMVDFLVLFLCAMKISL